MKRRILKAFVVALVVFGVLGFFCSRFYSPDLSDNSDSSEYVVYTTPNGEEKHIYTDSEAFEDHAQNIIEERKKALQSSTSSFRPLVAHAEKTAYYEELQDKTRFNDKWMNGNASSGVSIGIDLATKFLQIDTAGENDEVIINSFYECAGKVGLTYLAYIDREWIPVLTEVVTCYAPEVPYYNDSYMSGVVNPPPFPEWSLRGIYPNELCYMRELDTGDITYFIYRPGGSTSVRVDAMSYNGTLPNSYDSTSGIRFVYDSNFDGMVEDSQGVHTFRTNAEDVGVYFVTSDVNTIFHDFGKQYNDSFNSNITIANGTTCFFCSYVITNDPEEKQDVVNTTTNVNYNWTYNQYPIYRISNTNLQTTYHSDVYDNRHYLTQNTINEYHDIGFDYDPNEHEFEIDYDVLRAEINNTFVPEFKNAFDLVYSAQPEIGLAFDATNNVLNYIDLIEDQTGGGGSVWIPPEYPEIDTQAVITATIPDYQVYVTQTVAENVITSSGRVLNMGWSFMDTLGLISIAVPLAVLAIFWRITGGD